MIVIDVPPAPAPTPPAAAATTSTSKRPSRSNKSSKSPTPSDSNPSDQLLSSSTPSLTPGVGAPLVYDVPTDLPLPPFAKPSKDVDRDLGRLYEAIAGARRIAVICGELTSISPAFKKVDRMKEGLSWQRWCSSLQPPPNPSSLQPSTPSYHIW